MRWDSSNQWDCVKFPDSTVLTLAAAISSLLTPNKAATEDFLMILLEPSCFWGNSNRVNLFENFQNKSIVYVYVLRLKIINMICY